jgi:hypothetical protein
LLSPASAGLAHLKVLRLRYELVLVQLKRHYSTRTMDETGRLLIGYQTATIYRN